MPFVTHLDQVRAGIRSAWPTGIACPPLVVRWRAGSDPASWATLVELAHVRRQHPDDPAVENLTQALGHDLVTQTVAPEVAQAAQYLVAGTLDLVSEAGPPGPRAAPSFSGAA